MADFRKETQYLTYEGECLRKTERAALIKLVNYDRELWVPLSVLSEDTREDLTVMSVKPQDISIAAWWARNNL